MRLAGSKSHKVPRLKVNLLIQLRISDNKEILFPLLAARRAGIGQAETDNLFTRQDDLDIEIASVKLGMASGLRCALL